VLVTGLRVRSLIRSRRRPLHPRRETASAFTRSRATAASRASSLPFPGHPLACFRQATCGTVPNHLGELRCSIVREWRARLRVRWAPAVARHPAVLLACRAAWTPRAVKRSSGTHARRAVCVAGGRRGRRRPSLQSCCSGARPFSFVRPCPARSRLTIEAAREHWPTSRGSGSCAARRRVTSLEFCCSRRPSSGPIRCGQCVAFRVALVRAGVVAGAAPSGRTRIQRVRRSLARTRRNMAAA